MERNDWFTYNGKKYRSMYDLPSYANRKIPVTLHEMPNTVVHCKTKAEYNDLMETYEKGGWEMHWAYKICNFEKGWCFVDVEEDFCVALKIQITDEKILTFNEFIEAQLNWEEQYIDLTSGTFKDGKVFTECENDHGELPFVQYYALDQAPYCDMGEAKPMTFFDGELGYDTPTYYEQFTTLDSLGYGSSVLSGYDSILSHSPMSTLSKIRKAFLSDTEKQLRKQGLKDDCGNWTADARTAYVEELMNKDKDVFKDLLKELDSE